MKKLGNKGVGLLAIWVSAAVALFTLYVIYSIMTPIVGQIDFYIYGYMQDPTYNVSQQWLNTYNSLSSFLQTSFTYLIFAAFVSLIIFVLVQSARRRTDEYEVADEEGF